MRSTELDQLFAPLSSLSGVGPKMRPLLDGLLTNPEQSEGARLIDLLFHLPHSLIDRRQRPDIDAIESGQIVTLEVTIDQHKPPPYGKNLPYRIHASNDTGSLDIVYFRAKGDWLARTMPVGETRIISGRADKYRNLLQIAHPDHVVKPNEIDQLALLEPVYPQTYGINNRLILKLMTQALAKLKPLPEWQDEERLQKLNWPSFMEALQAVHRPQSLADAGPLSSARQRLAYDEFLASQLALQLTRATSVKAPGRAVSSQGVLAKKMQEMLPFVLTGAQERAFRDIKQDLFAPSRMLRLIQGDVGAGKTVVALLAALEMIDAGYQVALMAPTEVLCRQHLESLTRLTAKLDVKIAILTGREKGVPRKKLLAELASGQIQLIIGTHALFQEDVIYQKLGLSIIDEQHRFGVHQRLALAGKGERVDLMIMTATPIPRTLMLAHFGDMDVSVLDEKPAGRLPITTVAMPKERIQEIVERLGELAAKGEGAYWICPLVENSELIDLVSAEDRFTMLKQRLGSKVGLVHGRMRGAEKDEVIQRFHSGEISVLVATTVVEVGVDVPQATVMVIEHAERFGLSQLHQLRGRVGRSDRQSHCVLLYQQPLGETAVQRIKVLRETNDGFVIAEEDLKLRGGGELLGTRQSGLPELKLSMIEYHGDLLREAHGEVKQSLTSLDKLTPQRQQALRNLLHLFRREAATKLIEAG